MFTGYKEECFFIGKARIIIFDFRKEFRVHTSSKELTVFSQNADKKEAIMEAIQRLNDNDRKYN